ncbi:MMPL family transporter [Intestinibacillus massiliensis]|nr:MMPL family transporter [Intestinibacillus massiliensis]
MKNKVFDRLLTVAVKKRKWIEKIFFILTIACLLCYPFVGVNYDLSEYLPESAPTRQALDVMEREFGYPGMARIMVKDVSMSEAKQLRKKISKVEGVDLVVGPDAMTDVYMGEGFVQNDLTDEFYKDGNAVFEIMFKGGDSDKETHQALDEIYEITGDSRSCFSGSAVSSKSRQETITREIAIAMVISIVIIFTILTLTTTSWFEPILFISIMLVAIILNMGSNLMFGSISFFTFSTAAILQLAVSMDYSIFLLHTFTAYKQQGIPLEQAMVLALREACKSILASGATTIVGFLAIALMEFSIGKDVGFVLTKGILCSLASVLLLMPALILRFNGKIEKTAHRPFLPKFDKFSRAMHKIRWPVLVFALLMAVPCYFGQGLNAFYYGDEALGAGPGTRYHEDTQQIDAVFGKSNVVLAIVPRQSNVREHALTTALGDLDFTNYALSLAGVLPKGIPEDFLPPDLVEKLHTDQYARVLISMKTAQESAYAFDCNQKLTDVVKRYYPEDSYVIGMTATTIDIRDILTHDYNRVSVLSLIGVAIVVLLTFRSVLVPVFVIIPIEIAIYLNMTIPYLIGDSMVYIGYIIVSCLQLGATIDYSILMTNNYLDARKTYERHEAAERAISRSALSILTSGSILTVVGYLLYFTSSIQAISQVGRLVGRGALLSMLLVLSLLPALLSAFDQQIHRQQNRRTIRRAKHRKRLDDLQVPEGNTGMHLPKLGELHKLPKLPDLAKRAEKKHHDESKGGLSHETKEEDAVGKK